MNTRNSTNVNIYKIQESKDMKTAKNQHELF